MQFTSSHNGLQIATFSVFHLFPAAVTEFLANSGYIPMLEFYYLSSFKICKQ